MKLSDGREVTEDTYEMLSYWRTYHKATWAYISRHRWNRYSQGWRKVIRETDKDYWTDNSNLDLTPGEYDLTKLFKESE